MSSAASIPWVEKYRPKSLSDVAAQPEVVAMLKRALLSQNLPHLLFYGPPGTGKTSTILALARDLFGPTLYRHRILELNASDDRGIAVIRERVKQFARAAVGNGLHDPPPPEESPAVYPCPPFKLIILDEADSLTADAQTALRRLMEVYARGTRFCLVCNYVSRLIDPLTSRCGKFRFRPVDEPSGVERLQLVAQTEGVQVDKDALLALWQVVGGDLRRGITLLQSVHRLASPSSPTSIALIHTVSGRIPDSVVESVYAWNGNDLAPSEIVRQVRTQIERAGYPVHTLVAQLLPRLIGDPLVDAHKKAQLAIELSRLDHALHDGADEILQLSSFLVKRQQLLHSN